MALKRRCVLVDVVSEDHDHDLSRQILDGIQCAKKSQGSTRTRDNALLAVQSQTHGIGILIRDLHQSVVFLWLKQLGLFQLAQGPDSRNIVALRGMRTDNLDGGRFRLQEPPIAREGAAGPHGGDKVGNLAPGLPPNLRPRGPNMGFEVRFILILIEHVKLRLGRMLHGPGDGPFGGARRWTEGIL